MLSYYIYDLKSFTQIYIILPSYVYLHQQLIDFTYIQICVFFYIYALVVWQTVSVHT